MPVPAPIDVLPPHPLPVRPELLAPAGDWDCVRAAVENGADAIYFGLERFNARMRAKNFTVADLPRLMEFLHRRGVKGYVTFNVLVFADELDAATDYVRAIITAGVTPPSCRMLASAGSSASFWPARILSRRFPRSERPRNPPPSRSRSRSLFTVRSASPIPASA